MYPKQKPPVMLCVHGVNRTHCKVCKPRVIRENKAKAEYPKLVAKAIVKEALK